MTSLLLIFLTITLSSGIRANVSPWSAICFADTLSFGLPIRYLHLQITKQVVSEVQQLIEQGKNVTESIGQLIFDVEAPPECSFRHEVVDRFDGQYIVRVRLYKACPYLVLYLAAFDDTPLCGSPIRIEKANGEMLLAEHCDCPEKPSLSEWMLKHSCPTDEPQVTEDLKRFPRINFRKVIKRVEEHWGNERYRYSASVCHYVIRDNRIRHKCYGEYTGFKSFIDEMLTSLSRKMLLPDTEFIFNLGDYPLERDEENPIPIVGWCGSTQTSDIVVPTYETTMAVVGGMLKVHLDVHNARGPKAVPWSEKDPRAVFRGRDSNQLRLDMARLSEKRPDLLDVGITRYFFFKEDENTPSRPSMLFHEFFKYRYLLNIDGTVAAYRFPFMLAGDSIIFKGGPSDFYEHFYSKLQPNVHYVPFELSGVERELEWARETDLNQTLTNMRQFVIDHLQPLNVFCYYALVLQEYSKRVKVRSGRDEGEREGKDGFEDAETPPSPPCTCRVEPPSRTATTPEKDEL